MVLAILGGPTAGGRGGGQLDDGKAAKSVKNGHNEHEKALNLESIIWQTGELNLS